MQKKHLPMVAIIGVDGSGKSTILSKLIKNYKHKMVQKNYFFRRSFRKIAKEHPKNNYEKPPHKFIYSTIKLLAEMLIWFVEYHREIVPKKQSGVLVFSDHFYFLKMMLDPRKYRYGGPFFLIKWVYNVVPKPDIYIFLDAPLEVVYKRKQEASKDEMEQLIKRHREFIFRTYNSYTINAADPIDKVLHNVLTTITKAIEN